MKNLKKQQGSMILEILLALGFFGLLAVTIIYLVLDGYTTSRQGSEQSQASVIASEGIEAARAIRDRDWNLISNYTQTGLQINPSNYWEFKGESTIDTIDKFTRQLKISSVYRNTNGDVAASGTQDAETKKIEVTVNWSFNPGSNQSFVLTEYLTKRL